MTKFYLAMEQLKTSNLLILILIFGCIEGIGTVTLLPGSVVQVCQAGDPLELSCTVNGTFIRWKFTARNSLGRLMEYGPSFISAEDESQQTEDIRVNSTTFTFMRASAQASSPLVSTLVINSVNRDLNGTVVNCEDFGTSMIASTTIHYVDKTLLGPIMISTIIEEYRADGISIVVEWTQQEGVSYNVTIIPMVPMIIHTTGSSSVQLSYNTEYNMSLEASAVCQSIVSSNITLFYANCGLLSLSAADNISTPSVIHSGLPIEGSMANLSCPPGMTLNGTNTTTCTRNREWEPNPQDAECIDICDAPSPPPNGYIDSYNRTAGGLAVNFACTNRTTCTCICPDDSQDLVLHTAICTLDGRWQPNLEEFCSRQNSDYNTTKSSSDINAITVMLATLVAVSLMSNAFLFITGYVCGQKCKKLDSQPVIVALHDIVHEDRELQSTGVDEQELELESNVAYGHFQFSDRN